MLYYAVVCCICFYDAMLCCLMLSLVMSCLIILQQNIPYHVALHHDSIRQLCVISYCILQFTSLLHHAVLCQVFSRYYNFLYLLSLYNIVSYCGMFCCIILHYMLDVMINSVVLVIPEYVILTWINIAAMLRMIAVFKVITV